MVGSKTLKPIKLGILGAAKIVPQAILEPARKIEGIEVVGIASMDLARAVAFSENYNLPKVFQGYQAIIGDDSVDAVYIALSNDLHCQWIVEAANKKKHILVEKPICLTRSEIQLIKNATSENKVIVQEALMTQHHPWQEQIKQLIDGNELGRLLKIDTIFNYNILPAIRKNSYRLCPEKGGGSFYDNSPYWIQTLQRCLDFPSLSNAVISAEGFSRFDGPNGIDSEFTAVVDFANGVSSTFVSSYNRNFEASHAFQFEFGNVTLRNFFKPSFGFQKLSLNIWSQNSRRTIHFDPHNYYCNQLCRFRDAVNGTCVSEPIKDIQERVTMIDTIYSSAKRGVNRIW